MPERLLVVVLGYIVRGPLGGLAWHHLQYVRGLCDLGHDVTFVEDSDDFPGCYDPVRGVTDTDPSYGLDFAQRAFDRLGIGERWAYHDAHAAAWRGPAATWARARCERADVVLDLSGVNPWRPWLSVAPVRVLVDTDPVFTQIKHLTDPDARDNAASHTAFFTFGENVSAGALPDDGFPWQPTRQPIVLPAWTPTPGPVDGAYTTVMQWDSYASREHRGRAYGMKSQSFAPYLDLPRRVIPRLEVALGSANAPRDALRDNGWSVRNPLALTRDPSTYQQYLRDSKAEFSVAKHGYVVSRSGWFSERSACYLASGRPVVVQDSGFTSWLPTGRGVLAFATPDEAVSSIEAVEGAYEAHGAAAREVAEAYFEAGAVLRSLLDRAASSR